MIGVMGKVEKGDKEWPTGLADLGKQEPPRLYYDGKWDRKLFDKCVAVVGSRRMTQYGLQVVEKLVPKLVDDGWTIVSGMMYGVDQAAHKICQECGGKTIAVLGWGIKNSEETREFVKKGGLAISEWEDQLGALWTFPRRDRIMAALASEIYIVEAALKSGSLITAEWGIKLKRKIVAVPGPITSRVSEGTNKLIADGLAKMWISESKNRSSNDTEISIALQCESLTVDELARKIGKSVQEVAGELSMLQISGEVKERGGKYYIVE
jgi:DNA processing protein